MFRWGFGAAAAAAGLYHLQAGMRAALAPGAAWDAGALDLFLAFWFLFAAFGLVRRQFWLVSMAASVLAGFTALELFIGLVGGWHRFAGLTEDGRRALAAGLARLGAVAVAWIWAVAAYRREHRGPPPPSR